MTVIVKNKTPLVVPTAVRRRAGFKSGDKLEFRVSDGVVTILPKPPGEDTSDEYTHAQREAIDRAVAEGLDDIKHGRLQGPFSSYKEFIASLHREARKLSKQGGAVPWAVPLDRSRPPGRPGRDEGVRPTRKYVTAIPNVSAKH